MHLLNCDDFFFLFRASAVATNTMLGLRAAAAAANFLPYARHQLPGHPAHDFFNNVNADKDFFRLKSQLDNEINNAGNNNKFGSTTPTSESNNRPDYDVKGKNLLQWQINSFYVCMTYGNMDSQVSKLARFEAKNQHTRRKLLDFVK